MRVIHDSSGGAQLLWCLGPGQCRRQPDTTERRTNALPCITRLALNGVTKSRCQDAPGRLAKLHSLRDACSLVRAWVSLSYCLAQEVPRCGTGLGCKSRICLSGPQFPLGTALLIPLLFSCTLAGLSHLWGRDHLSLCQCSTQHSGALIAPGASWHNCDTIAAKLVTSC